MFHVLLFLLMLIDLSVFQLLYFSSFSSLFLQDLFRSVLVFSHVHTRSWSAVTITVLSDFSWNEKVDKGEQLTQHSSASDTDRFSFKILET